MKQGYIKGHLFSIGGPERCMLSIHLLVSFALPGKDAAQGKVDKLSEALRASQRQAKQADSEAQQMEKAFRVLQNEVHALATRFIDLLRHRGAP